MRSFINWTLFNQVRNFFLKATKFITMLTKTQHSTLHIACSVQLTSSYHHYHSLSSVFSNARLSFRLLLLQDKLAYISESPPGCISSKGLSKFSVSSFGTLCRRKDYRILKSDKGSSVIISTGYNRGLDVPTSRINWFDSVLRTSHDSFSPFSGRNDLQSLSLAVNYKA